MLAIVIRVEIHKMLVRIAIREDPDQTASDLDLHCLPRLFWQACLKILTIYHTLKNYSSNPCPAEPGLFYTFCKHC